MWLHLENKIYTVKTQVLTPKPYQTLIFITYPNLSYVQEAQFKSCHTKNMLWINIKTPDVPH